MPNPDRSETTRPEPENAELAEATGGVNVLGTFVKETLKGGPMAIVTAPLALVAESDMEMAAEKQKQAKVNQEYIESVAAYHTVLNRMIDNLEQSGA